MQNDLYLWSSAQIHDASLIFSSEDDQIVIYGTAQAAGTIQKLLNF